MRLFIWPLMLAFVVGCASQTSKPVEEQSARQLQAELTRKHPSAYLHLARELFERGDKNDAAMMYYVGQIRYRAYINTLVDNEAASQEQQYEELKSEIGDDINEYAARNVDNWVRLLDRAVEWHEKNPNEFLPKEEYSLLYELTLYHFNQLRDYVASNKELIRRQRAEQGLVNE